MADALICHFFIHSFMNLTTLTVTDFRNFEKLAIHPVDGTNIFYGRNGSGKTNLLEAIFTLCLGRSQRSANDAVMIRDSMDVYRVVGIVSRDGDDNELAVAYQRGGRKKITLDRLSIRIGELFERFAVVAAGPEDSLILSGPPSARRSFVDVYLSQYSKDYLRHIMDYAKILAQKNAALKENMDPGPFNTLMVQEGSAIMRFRERYLAEVNERAGNYYHNIAPNQTFQIAYQPSIRYEASDNIEEAFDRRLIEVWERERIMQSSLVGPHRDDVDLSIGGTPARSHGSQGELRSAAISLKLAVYDLLKDRRSIRPILLLDEIFAELDPGRVEALAGCFHELGQVFVTTADQPPAVLRENSRNFRIADGSVEEIH
jgi:DNA replication and repair protein RecF